MECTLNVHWRYQIINKGSRFYRWKHLVSTCCYSWPSTPLGQSNIPLASCLCLAFWLSMLLVIGKHSGCLGVHPADADCARALLWPLMHKGKPIPVVSMRGKKNKTSNYAYYDTCINSKLGEHQNLLLMRMVRMNLLDLLMVSEAGCLAKPMWKIF